MPPTILVPKYRRDPNEKVEAIYSGVAPGNRTVTTIIKPSLDRNSMEATREYGDGLPRGVGGRIAVLVLGGMETTLDEMEYIIEAKKQKPFKEQKKPWEIADMCRLLLQRRNERILRDRKYYKANPSERPKKRTVRLHLPVGYRMVNTSEPGLRILAAV